MFYNTNHSDMDAPHYEQFDGITDVLPGWMCHYTHHRDMYLQPICCTERSITHITAIWTFPNMYTLMYFQMSY